MLEDKNITAVFTQTKEHTVIFKDYDESVLKTETVEHGSSATAPEDPTREGHTFTDWDIDFDNINIILDNNNENENDENLITNVSILIAHLFFTMYIGKCVKMIAPLFLHYVYCEMC